jgi:hypothetical protein
MRGLSRPKDGVLSHAYDPRIHGGCLNLSAVIAGQPGPAEGRPGRKLDSAIHKAVPTERQYCFACCKSSWMRGSSPRMTLAEAVPRQ